MPNECNDAEELIACWNHREPEREASELDLAMKILRDVNEVLMDAGDDWWYGVHYKEASDLIDSYDNRRRGRDNEQINCGYMSLSC